MDNFEMQIASASDAIAVKTVVSALLAVVAHQQAGPAFDAWLNAIREHSTKAIDRMKITASGPIDEAALRQEIKDRIGLLFDGVSTIKLAA